MPENFIDGCFVYIHKKKLIILLILLSAVSIGFCFVVLPKIMADKPKKIIVNEPEMEDYSGKAVLIYKDSENVLYEGDMVDGHAEGFGMLYSENGKLIYEGGFSDDMYCGQGKLYAEDGSVIYIGLFENNRYHGHGTLYNILGEVLYTGGFSNGVYDGTGELSSAGLVYSGQFKEGLLSGE